MPQIVKNIIAVLITVIIAAVIVGVAFLYVHLYDASAQRDWNNTQETNQACLDMVDSNIKSDISSIKNPSVRKLMQDQHSALVALGSDRASFGDEKMTTAEFCGSVGDFAHSVADISAHE